MPRRRIVFAALLASLPVVVRPAPAHADDYALVVGVQSYKHDNGFTPLHYTEDDARELKNTLERVGFRVKLLSTAADSLAVPTKESIKTAVQDVCSDADADSTLIVFLAGHGKSVLQGDEEQEPRSVFCPYDVQENAEKNKYENTIDIMSEVVDVMKGSRAGRKFLFIDACRDLNKRGGPGFRIPKNLKLKPPGVDVIFSCSTNELASERSGLNHGVFTYYLIQALKFGTGRSTSGGISISELHSFLSNKVSSYVRDKIKDTQNPQNPDWIPKGATTGSDVVAPMKPIGSERTITCRARAFDLPDDIPKNVEDITNDPDQSGTRRNPRVFKDVTFTGDFIGVNFTGAQFINCRFKKCRFFGGTKLNRVRMRDCVFERADFSAVDCTLMEFIGRLPLENELPWGSDSKQPQIIKNDDQ